MSFFTYISVLITPGRLLITGTSWHHSAVESRWCHWTSHASPEHSNRKIPIGWGMRRR